MYLYIDILSIICRNWPDQTTISHNSHTTDFSYFLFSGILSFIKKLSAYNFAEFFSNTYLKMTVKIKKNRTTITYLPYKYLL